MFPQPVPLTGRSVGWIESEVTAWIQAQHGLNCSWRAFCRVAVGG
ncbi:hypothetical protein IPC224_03700 [Pseudomonas aeruginosa]|nr:AlpA family phage regulatory protein [Pseudomonas aeruginosa]RQG59996.1 hypothetical protein IPC224_03700 [Pseudomonas aeruginosa]